MATGIAERQEELRAAGWKVLTCDPALVTRLNDKVAFLSYARELGLSSYLPERYITSLDAVYPCILKFATGEFGINTHLVRAAEDVQDVTGRTPEAGALEPEWLLQELVPGRLEYSTSMLVVEGEVVDVVCMRYEYDSEEYVWPQVREVNRHLEASVPGEHLAAMKLLLHGYSGFCNFNYKVRPDGRPCFFEANARVGADLSADAPRWRARQLFEALEARCG